MVTANTPQDLLKGIAIIGNVGTGKTKAMEIMNKYLEIDNVFYVKNNKQIPLRFQVFNSRQIVEDFAQDGFEGLHKYTYFHNICIDDLGTENLNPVYYGTKLNVIEEIIEERYRKGLMTHLTSNLNEEMLLDSYGDRVYSRLKNMINYHQLIGNDLRK